MESTKQIIETINSNKFTFIFIVLLLSTVLFSLISRLAYNLKTCEIIKQEAVGGAGGAGGVGGAGGGVGGEGGAGGGVGVEGEAGGAGVGGEGGAGAGGGVGGEGVGGEAGGGAGVGGAAAANLGLGGLGDLLGKLPDLKILTVPSVIGMTQRNAAFTLYQNELQHEQLDYPNSVDREMIGKVVSQDPNPGTIAAPQSIVKIYFGRKTTNFIVPDVVGKTTEEATRLIRNAGLITKTESYTTFDINQLGKIISQEPVGGTRLFFPGEVKINFGVFGRLPNMNVFRPIVLPINFINVPLTPQPSGTRTEQLRKFYESLRNVYFKLLSTYPSDPDIISKGIFVEDAEIVQVFRGYTKGALFDNEFINTNCSGKKNDVCNNQKCDPNLTLIDYCCTRRENFNRIIVGYCDDIAKQIVYGNTLLDYNNGNKETVKSLLESGKLKYGYPSPLNVNIERTKFLGVLQDSFDNFYNRNTLDINLLYDPRKFIENFYRMITGGNNMNQKVIEVSKSMTQYLLSISKASKKCDRGLINWGYVKSSTLRWWVDRRGITLSSVICGPGRSNVTNERLYSFVDNCPIKGSDMFVRVCLAHSLNLAKISSSWNANNKFTTLVDNLLNILGTTIEECNGRRPYVKAEENCSIM